MASERTSAGTVLAAFVFGALAGAALALLYAPAPGEETRRKVIDKAREGRRRAEAAMREGGEMLRQQAEHLGDTIQQGAEAFERARKDRL
jgi:gas vesicle protein